MQDASEAHARYLCRRLSENRFLGTKFDFLGNRFELWFQVEFM
jgi:hypothetical protein